MKTILNLCVSLMLLVSVLTHAADYEIKTVVDGLTFPWAIAFLPDGDVLVTERTGQLRRISEGVLQEQVIANVPDLYVGGQGGLLDIILDNDFERNQRMFISLSSGSAAANANATQVISARLEDDSLEDIKVIFIASTPGKDTPHHFGGRLALLPDQTLLVTVGDGFDFREKAQYLDTHFGKVIRINKDGSLPSDNPFVGRADALPEIWSYGHRNPQGLLVSADGSVWLHEHGPKGGDELNLIQPGKNYGWPAITYGMDYSGAYVSPYTEFEGMEQPVTYWVPSIAPGGFCEYQGDEFPQWQGDLFVAALAEKSVHRLKMRNHEVVEQETLFLELDERIREVSVGPDGYLYLLTDSKDGRLLRVVPAGK